MDNLTQTLFGFVDTLKSILDPGSSDNAVDNNKRKSVIYGKIF